MILSGYGISLDLPANWEGRIFMLEPDPGALVFPIVHAGNFPLPADRSNYGSGVTMKMNGHGAFLTLVEYDPGMLKKGDFALTSLRLPVNETQLIDAQSLNVPSGLTGYRALFNRANRPFSLKLVLGNLDSVGTNLSEALGVLSSLKVSSAA